MLILLGQAPHVKVSSHIFKNKICSFTMAFMLDHMKSLLEKNPVYELGNAESVMPDRLKNLVGLPKRSFTHMSQ